MKLRIIIFISFILFFINHAYCVNTFTPPPGKVLLIIGQDIDNIDQYVKSVKIIPAGCMTYTSLSGLEGLESDADAGDGVQNAHAILTRYPNTVLQIGLYIVGMLDQINDGALDQNIDRLGTWIKGTDRPVFLRIGYEFDYSNNHYSPSEYIQAYKYIVDRLRKKDVRNAAFVWHSCAGRNNPKIMDWYPGDDYVDWVAASYFNQFPKFINQVAEVAKRLNKPFMLAETSPWYIKDMKTRELWYKRLFDFINSKNVAAICYINADWDAHPMWESQHWGDTRVQSYPTILNLWINETSQDKYIKSSPNLFKQIDWNPSQN